MEQNIEEAIGNWCQCLASREIDEHLQTLEMVTRGSKFVKLNRLTQWLLGEYNPEDFLPEEGQNELALGTRRENLWTAFILEQSKADLPPAWANITGDTEGEQHPLTMLAEDEVTKANLEATRLGVLKQQPSEPKERDPTGSNP